jgi:hypothetical protein
MDETTTIARTPSPAQAPELDVLFQPYRLGPFNLRHRIVMAPLLAGARHRTEFPCRLLLRAARIRSVNRERGHAGFDAGSGLPLDARSLQP